MRFVTGGDASALLGSGEPSGPAAALPPFASLGFKLGGSGTSGKSLLEPRTKTQFPAEYCLRAGRRNCPVITGVGPRTKRLAGIKSLDIYALGLYVAPGSTRQALRGFRDQPAASLAKSQALFDQLLAADGVEKTLRLVITSKLVTKDKFLDQLSQLLEGPLRKAKALDSLDRFKAQFGDVPFRKGMTVALTSSGGQLITQVDGQQKGSIASKPLAHEMFRLYLGKDPISQPAKDNIGKGLADIVLA